MNARPAPRKSSLAGASPVAPAVTPTPVTPAPAAPAPTGVAPARRASTATSKGQDAARSKHAPKVSFYQDPDDTQRMRGAIRFAMAQEGSRGLSDFIHSAVMLEVERLEQRYNDGKPFEPAAAGELPQGRPMGE